MPIKELSDGTEYEKATHHSDKLLKGEWLVTLKIDGVRALRNKDGTVVSRNSKPLYNLDHLRFLDCEVFRKDWSTSVSLVRSKTYQRINQNDIYELAPGNTDPRLNTGMTLTDSTYAERMEIMALYVSQGYEGIVLRQLGGTKWIKVVPKITVDIRITGYKMGNGRLDGLVGSFETAHGSVGSGLNDEMRQYIKKMGAESFIGQIIEVEYREKTAAGKLRFPAFLRFRFDKDEESLT